MSEWVVIGRVARPHGVRGALKLHLDNADSETLRKGLVVRVGDREMKIAKVSGGHRYAFEGLDDRNDADALRGKPVAVRREDLPAIDDEEFYLVDVIGLEVFDEGGARLGELKAFSDNGAQLLARVKTAGGVVEVPFVRPILVAIEEDRVILAPPGGLFDDDAEVAGEAP
jgi:16S rRNA processing protein RimM